MQKNDVIVVGAGAAGLLAAGRAAERGAKVLVFEKMRQEGRKLMITGKGRCNITNNAPLAEFIKHIHPNGKFLRNAFSHFFSEDIIDLLKQNGLEVTLERGGRYFPASNKAPDVVKTLLKWVRLKGVTILCGQKVEKLLVENGTIKGLVTNGQSFFAEKVIIATGGKSYPATGSNGDGYKLVESLGHTIVQPFPSLVGVDIEGNSSQPFTGLELKNVKAVVWVNEKKLAEDFGELSFTESGLAGPIILTLSRKIVEEHLKGNNVKVTIDLKPALDDQKLDKRLQRDLNEKGKMRLPDLLKGLLPSAMVPGFVQLLKMDANKECHQISGKERSQIRYLLKNMAFEISGHRSFKEAIVTAGGVSTKEISPNTMESKLVKGLFFAGEVIDVDADTGGYNLQIAFSTGWVAGNSIIQD